MSFEMFLVIIVGFANCEAQEINIHSCGDIKQAFDNKNDLKLNEEGIASYIFQNLPQLHENLDQYNVNSAQFIFNNKTELLLSALFTKIFEKLMVLRKTKLNEVILKLKQEQPLRFEYFFLNTVTLNYNKSKNIITEAEKIDDDYLPDTELKKQANYLICAFLTLANLTNNYYTIQEVLKPLEVILEDDESSSAMLIFINQFLSEAMEGNDGIPLNIYRNLFTKYIINQLQTIDAFNISDLLGLQNKSDLEIKKDFEKSTEQYPKGILIKWRFKMQDIMSEIETSEYFHKIDETFREVSKNTNDIRSRIGSFNKKIIINPKKDPRAGIIITRHKARVQKLLGNIKAVNTQPGTSPLLLKFAKEILQQLNSSRTILMPIIYDYIGKELSAIEPFNTSLFKAIRDMKMEELAPILNEHLVKDPTSITTMALDWIFTMKIEILANGNDNNLLDTLKSTFRLVQERRAERTRKGRTQKVNRKTIKINTVPEEFDKNDEDLLLKASLL